MKYFASGQQTEGVNDSNFMDIKPDENGAYPNCIRRRSIFVNSDFIVLGLKNGVVRVYDRELTLQQIYRNLNQFQKRSNLQRMIKIQKQWEVKI